jgi:nucleoside-diphosphate-sugar epimerase
LSRRDVTDATSSSGIKYLKTDYTSVSDLSSILQGVNVVLSFIAPFLDQEEAFNVQKNLIDASVQAGVKRFAPSEWGSASFEHLSWYTYKALTRQYLLELNKNERKIEYSLFQPGLFTNYFTRPYNSSKHVKPIEMPYDFQGKRALVREGGEEDKLTLTTVQDLANVVARAVEFEGEWPVVGGITGTKLSIGQIVALGEEIRGMFFPYSISSRPQPAS